ncbi:hypothetical protein GCM10028801_23450 [Nocardioides maradonensis]
MSEPQEHQTDDRTTDPTDDPTDDPSAASSEAPMGVPDEALPEDLVAGEDNPLAEGLPPGETADGLLDPEDEDGQDGAQGVQTGSAPQEQ